MNPEQMAEAGGGARVLIVDDELEIRRIVGARLAGEGFAVESAATAAAGLDLVARWHPDVVLLDLTLPDRDGIAVCRELRGWSAVPVLVLSARLDEKDKVAALEAGADDYLTKPFFPRELVARIRVALRHAAQAAASQEHEAVFQTGGLRLDFARRRVEVDGAEQRLTPTEYEVLKYLAHNAGKVITHRMLLRGVWGPQYEDEPHYLHVFIAQLRRKIEPNPSRPRYLLTTPGVGYRLREPDAE